MGLTTLPLSALRAPKRNPRRTFDVQQIGALSRSILADGVLQNLIVRAEGDDAFRVISGKRRYLALQRLRDAGDIEASYPVPVEIKEDLSEADALRLATVENVQREQLNPVDEADAFAKLLQSGGTVEAIADKTGLSLQTVKRRLVLAALCPDAKKALRAGLISRAIAEALSLGSHAQQQSLLESLDVDAPPEPEDIREMLLRHKPSVAMAIFPREEYNGTITTDLFSDDETSYFDDVDQFLALQKAAVEKLADEHRARAAWVELLNLYTVPWWQWRQAEGDEPAGVVINLHPNGSVEIREGLAKHEVKEEVAAMVRQTPLAPRPIREKPEFGVEFIRYIVKHKSAVVQASLLRNARKAKEVAALLLLLGTRYESRVRLSPHSCLSLMTEQSPPLACRAIEEIATGLANVLGIVAKDERPNQLEDGIARLLTGGAAHDLYEAMGNLTDHELDQLMVLLPILCFGQQDPDTLDTDESLFNRIAAGLGINMREWWTPDATFLSGIRREQLLMVALDIGAVSHIQGLTSRTKLEIVEELTRYFNLAASAETIEDLAYRRAREWLPGILKFPASGGLADPQT